MNIYKKFCAKVFIAKCEEEYKKGDLIILTTKYNKEHECEVHNLIKNGIDIYYYSITRTDGLNSQERARIKAEKIKSWIDSANSKSNEYYNKSNKDQSFLSLGEPIKIGHHSEKRHRKIIDKANNNMRKCVEFSKKAESYEEKLKYWKSQENKIDLSMPESLDFYKLQLKDAEDYYDGLKNKTIERLHSYSLSYARKKAKDIKRKYDIALVLWQ